jgi:hypothetical protein
MMMVPFVAIAVGLSIAGLTMLLGAKMNERLAGFGVLLAAAVVTGAYVSANFNGGKPYGFDIAIGVEPWRHEAVTVQPVSMPQQPEEKKQDDAAGVPIV